MAEHNDTGKKGEDAAAEFLQANGHTIVARNYRFGRAEVDIISTDGNLLVFTEVKTRGTEQFGYPEEFVDKGKQRRMKKAAAEYTYQNKSDAGIRFDIISITNIKGGFKIHHIKDAFFHAEGM